MSTTNDDREQGDRALSEPKPDPTWILNPEWEKAELQDLAARSGRIIKRNPEYDDAPYEVTVTVDIRNKTAHMLLRA